MSTPEPATPTNNRWPRQILYIIGSEAAERFSYYGMRSILALYITSQLAQTKDQATTIIHFFIFANYFTPLLGAWVSDRLWGRYNTILWVSFFYCAGHGVLATSDLFVTNQAKLLCLYAGLGLIAFGAGGIKPCVSAFMGDQFKPDQSHLMRLAYGVFYFSINFGSFFAFLIIPAIAKGSGYSWAFGVPGLVMGLATLVFWLGTRHYVLTPPARETRTAGFFTVFLTALRNVRAAGTALTGAAVVSFANTILLPVVAMIGMVVVALSSEMTPAVRAVGWGALGCVAIWYLLILAGNLTGLTELPDKFWQGARRRFRDSEISAAKSVAPILAVLALVPAFWALFDQSNSTWVLQGKDMQPFRVLGYTIGPEEMQSLNPLLVMILVPVLNLGVYPLCELLGLRMTALRRMSVGMVLAALSFVSVAWLQQRLEAGETLSLAWQALPYVVLTTGEVLVSSTGLEFAYTQAAPSMKSTIMSFWLVTVAIGNLLVTTITQLGGGHGAASVSSGRFFLYSGMAAVVSILFMLIAATYRERKYELAGSEQAPRDRQPAV